MLKPIKKINPSSKDNSANPNRTTDDLTETTRVNTQLPELHANAADSDSGRRFNTETPSETTPQSAVIVTEMPGSPTRAATVTVESALSTITWPKDRLDELVPFRGKSGLFTSNDGTLFADIKGLGKTMVERNSLGDYQVPFPFAPGVPGPILARIDGEPHWRIDRPGWVKASAQTAMPQTAPPLKVLPAELANLLSPARPMDGIRHDKTGRAYVDIPNEGTVLIRKNADGEYQVSDFNERLPSGPLVERIQGTGLWQRTPELSFSAPDSPRLYIHESPDIDADTGASQTKRPRLEESRASSDPVESPETVAQVSRASVESPYSWMQWGHYEGPPSGASVRLGGFDYSVVPLGSESHNQPRLFFLQNPEYAVSRFDEFERMLREAPALQPVAIYRYTNDPLEVRPSQKLFHKPLSQSVAERFTDFSEATAQSVAKNLFERADNSQQITTTGLNNILQVLTHWNWRATAGVPSLGDPLLMLQPAPRVEQNARTYLSIDAATDAPLHRLTFDPQRFPEDWNYYCRTLSNQALRQLTGGLLVRAGYDVFPLTPQHLGPTLIFRGPATDDVFFLKLGAVEGNAITLHTQPGTELADPFLPARIGKEAYQAVLTAHANNKLIWLLGGVLNVRSKPESVFIIRER
ncbi:hypothetical protein ACIQVE_11995 [Pseudomonas sp. NPDC098747]|uniref:hypothetical protein n=1 Tax=Pseudomonas sp. NPDC098747 TaxID=3364487 RepID=UPI00383AB307